MSINSTSFAFRSFFVECDWVVVVVALIDQVVDLLIQGMGRRLDIDAVGEREAVGTFGCWVVGK